MNAESKNYASTYLYGKANYTAVLTDAIMMDYRIDKESDKFAGVIQDITRRATNTVLIEVLKSPNVVLLMMGKPLPSTFNVFAAKDIKKDRKTKIFIDITSIMDYKNGYYICKNIDVFISQLISALDYIIYYGDPKRIVNNNELVTLSTDLFVSLFTHILDYMRLSGFSENKERISYIVALYYQVGILGKELEQSKIVAAKVAGIPNKSIYINDVFIPDGAAHFTDINVFITHLSTMFKFKNFTTDIFVNKWLWLYGTGTQFATELYPAFSSMITNTYSGVYLNNQKTIEKVCGKQLVTYTTALLKVGYDAYNKKL